MRSQMLTTLNFNLRSGKGERRAIYAVFYDGKEQKKVALNEKVFVSFWDKKAQRAKVSPSLSEEEIKNQMEINQKITAVRAYYEENFLYICTQELITNIQNICGMANEKNLTAGRKYSAKKLICAAFEDYCEKERIQPNTKKTKQPLINKFVAYIEESGRDSLNHLTEDGIYKFVAYLQKEGMNPQRINQHIRQIRGIINYIATNADFRKYGLNKVEITLLKEFKRDTTQKGKIALTDEEILRFEEVNLEDGELKRAQELFLLQCLLGVRVGEFKNILKGEYKIIDGYITYKTEKGNNDGLEPYEGKIREYLEKYEGTKLNERKYNDNLKVIAEKAEINREIEVITTSGEKEIKKAYELISSHCARHTDITNRLRGGLSAEEVAQHTGHKTTKYIENTYNHLTIEDRIKMDRERRTKGEKTAQTAPQTYQNDQIIKEYFGDALATTNTNPNYTIDDYKKLYYMIGGNFIDIMDVDDVEQALIIYANKAHNIHLLGIEDGDIFALYEKPKLSLQSKKMILGEMIKKQLDKPLAQRIKEEEGKTLKMYEEFADVLEEIRGEN